MATSGRRILVGVSGSIAAVKTPELVRLLVDKEFDVQCVMTKGAKEFASSLALATFSSHPVVEDIFGSEAFSLPHIVHSEKADLFVVAPATATLLGRFANGLADDIVSLCYITTRAPVLVAPAMHPSMWEHAAIQANVKTLRDRGVHFVGPTMGPLADKTRGDGRMSEPENIVQAIEKILPN
ncbi:MAG: Coenzyme A biosynthesis bifunctional protein CoaBC [Elusimicrobia bacterium]|nr:Coenzyme A biosynthesis bifunctional protein CoaBC [Elusimicrobiota bacterium]